MKIAYIIFDGITWLDFIGVYDPISRLKSGLHHFNLSWDICAFSDECKDNHGLGIKPWKIKNDLSGYDAIIIPGGFGTDALEYDRSFIEWIMTAHPVRYKISVCTGSIILGAAGFLRNKKATTHFEVVDRLRPYCQEVLSHRIVQDDHVITAAGVSAGIDLGLFLCKEWGNKHFADAIKKQMCIPSDYQPEVWIA